jgi:hypothetical protein
MSFYATGDYKDSITFNRFKIHPAYPVRIFLHIGLPLGGCELYLR